MSDLKHEDSHEEKKPPTLSDMSVDILTRIANELDFVSRTQLQRTCRGFREFINSYCSTCDGMTITFKRIESGLQLELSIDQLNVQYIEQQNGCLVKVEKEEKEKFLRNSHFLGIGLADFKNAIKNPNLKIGKLAIHLVFGSISMLNDAEYTDKNGILHQNINDYFFDKLSKILQSLDQKLKVGKLSVHTHKDEKYAISILSNIQPEKLDEICIGFFEVNSRFWAKFFLNTNQLTNSEHWRTAKSLRINNLYLDIPVENISHFDEFAGILTSLSPENIVFLKETYLQSATFKSCYIEIESNNNRLQPQNQIEIEEVDNLLGPVIPFDRKHVRHYPIPNSNQWLLMKITPKSFHIYKTDSPDSYLNPPKLCEQPIHFRLVPVMLRHEVGEEGVRHRLQGKIRYMK